MIWRMVVCHFSRAVHMYPFYFELSWIYSMLNLALPTRSSTLFTCTTSLRSWSLCELLCSKLRESIGTVSSVNLITKKYEHLFAQRTWLSYNALGYLWEVFFTTGGERSEIRTTNEGCIFLLLCPPVFELLWCAQPISFENGIVAGWEGRDYCRPEAKGCLGLVTNFATNRLVCDSCVNICHHSWFQKNLSLFSIQYIF